jgi:hypothetical protein
LSQNSFVDENLNDLYNEIDEEGRREMIRNRRENYRRRRDNS